MGVLKDLSRLYPVTDAIEKAMQSAYENRNRTASSSATCASDDSALAACEGLASEESSSPPGNFHGVKSHSYYVSAISEAHPAFPAQAVQSIVASEWYHPGLTAEAVWCTEGCGHKFPLARRLDENFEDIRREVERFWRSPDAAAELKGVGSHTTQFDKMIAGNGTWVDVRLWRGRAFNTRLCARHFRVICGLVEASPEIWTNPWSHVLLSVLFRDSWVPFHQGHTNGQLTYHLPVMIPQTGGVAELAVVDRGGTLSDDNASRVKLLSHLEERTVRWVQGSTLVFDDSFTHAVRFRSDVEQPSPTLARQVPEAAEKSHIPDARVVLLMRGWHPELDQEERIALRDFIRRGGEEDPEGYAMLPIAETSFAVSP